MKRKRLLLPSAALALAVLLSVPVVPTLSLFTAQSETATNVIEIKAADSPEPPETDDYFEVGPYYENDKQDGSTEGVFLRNYYLSHIEVLVFAEKAKFEGAVEQEKPIKLTIYEQELNRGSFYQPNDVVAGPWTNEDLTGYYSLKIVPQMTQLYMCYIEENEGQWPLDVIFEIQASVVNEDKITFNLYKLDEVSGAPIGSMNVVKKSVEKDDVPYVGYVEILLDYPAGVEYLLGLDSQDPIGPMSAGFRFEIASEEEAAANGEETSAEGEAQAGDADAEPEPDASASGTEESIETESAADGEEQSAEVTAEADEYVSESDPPEPDEVSSQESQPAEEPTEESAEPIGRRKSTESTESTESAESAESPESTESPNVPEVIQEPEPSPAEPEAEEQAESNPAPEEPALAPDIVESAIESDESGSDGSESGGSGSDGSDPDESESDESESGGSGSDGSGSDGSGSDGEEPAE